MSDLEKKLELDKMIVVILGKAARITKLTNGDKYEVEIDTGELRKLYERYKSDS